MSWKPPHASADRLRAKLEDEFETVARPEGLRRTSDARREGGEASAAEAARAMAAQLRGAERWPRPPGRRRKRRLRGRPR